MRVSEECNIPPSVYIAGILITTENHKAASIGNSGQSAAVHYNHQKVKTRDSLTIKSEEVFLEHLV